MTPAELEEVTRGTTCDVERGSVDGFHASHCKDPADKLVVLGRLAVLDVRRDPRVRRVALEVLRGVRRGRDGRHDPRGAAEAMHRYVRDVVPYVGEGVETFQPTHTTLRYGGDCDDSARALRALTLSVGIPSRLAPLQKCERGKCWNSHVAAQIWDGRAWQWAETTIRAELGEHPRSALRRLKALGLAPAPRPDLGDLEGVGFGAFGELMGVGDTHCSELAVERDIDARKAIVDAWALYVAPPEMTPQALQYVQAICRLESQYGLGWGGTSYQAHLKGSHNWGAVQLAKSPVVKMGKDKPTLEALDAAGLACPAGSAPGVDTFPDGVHYAVCFRTYVDDAAGAFDVLREIFRRKDVRALLPTGDSLRLAEAMYDSHYFGGFGAREHAIAEHAATVDCHVVKIAAAMHEPVRVKVGGIGLASRGVKVAAGALALAALGGGGYYAYRHWRPAGRRRR